MTADHIYTVASDCCDSSQVGPWELAVDATGNIIMSEPVFPLERVRVVAEKSGTFYGVLMVRGQIYTVGAGSIPTAPTALKLLINSLEHS
jgi:hypothetical protein